MNDQDIIKLFFERSEQGISELDAKYGEQSRRFSENIVGNTEDAEECVNDSYLKVWETVPPKNPDPLKAFLLRIVRNISVNRYHANNAQKRKSVYSASLEELSELASGEDVYERFESAELARFIEKFVSSLSRENRVIFMRRYFFAQGCAEIGTLLGYSEKNVTVRLSRIRKKLKKYLLERGVEV
jgi:RNA polymerase sigma-70 factor (ECF subfamily)